VTLQIKNLSRGDEALLYMERYGGGGTKGYSSFSARNEAGPQFHPESENSSLEVVTVRVPREWVTVFQAAPDPALAHFYNAHNYVLFAIHPEIWGDFEVSGMEILRRFPRGEVIAAVPTASTRTVFVTELDGVVPNHYLKLHLPRRVSRFNRRLRHLNIANSVAVTKDLREIRFHKFAYLGDTLGFTLGNEHDSWGFLVREATALPFEGTHFLIPCFALYGCDLKNPEDRPLLIQLIKASGEDPENFVTEEIIVPVIECWTHIARERRILLESHAQNTLLEVDADFRPRRIVHRDFDVWIDREARRRAGLSVAFEGDADDGENHPIEQQYSLVYDHFMGREFFDYLLNCLRPFYDVDEEAIRERAREAFHRGFPDADSCFPSATTFYFSDAPAKDNKVELIDMKQKPEWR
jgi:siderophore synthetase component